MDIKKAIHILRNPYCWSAVEEKEARIMAANELEQWQDAYEKLLEWAKDNGLDTTTYNR